LSQNPEASLRSARRVLVVEDNEHTAYMLEFLLHRAGYEVMVAPNGRDAQEIMRNVPPVDVIVLDLMLPYVSGYQIILDAREDADWRDVPILVLSGKVLEMDVTRALDQGADDYVTKPFRPQELLARIRRLIATRERLRA
jgi:DNA-binding response OmpR family regulator